MSQTTERIVYTLPFFEEITQVELIALLDNDYIACYLFNDDLGSFIDIRQDRFQNKLTLLQDKEIIKTFQYRIAYNRLYINIIK
jgi:hypothetical protein